MAESFSASIPSCTVTEGSKEPMDVVEGSVGRAGCPVHEDRPAVERCGRCGRTACIGCAIPVRGRVLCTECATVVVGRPAAPPPPKISGRLDAWILGCFAAGILATVPPWDRFGAFTSPLSAWRPDPDARPLAAAVAMVLGALLSYATFRRPTLGFGRWLPRLIVTLAFLALLAIAASIVGAPEYVSHTPAPYAALAASAGALVVSAIRLRRRRMA